MCDWEVYKGIIYIGVSKVKKKQGVMKCSWGGKLEATSGINLYQDTAVLADSYPTRAVRRMHSLLMQNTTGR